jgi:hypothetical protein
MGARCARPATTRATRIPEIEFANGSVIQYSGVGEDLHRGLMSSASAASYFKDHIEEDFPSRRLR